MRQHWGLNHRAAVHTTWLLAPARAIRRLGPPLLGWLFYWPVLMLAWIAERRVPKKPPQQNERRRPGRHHPERKSFQCTHQSRLPLSTAVHAAGPRCNYKL